MQENQAHVVFEPCFNMRKKVFGLAAVQLAKLLSGLIVCEQVGNVMCATAERDTRWHMHSGCCT